MQRLLLILSVFLFVFSSFTLFPGRAHAQPREFRTDVISGGAETNHLTRIVENLSTLQGSPTIALSTGVFTPGVGFLGYNFDDNATETGFLFIPPDPCGSAGTDRVLSVVNKGIECRSKTGTLLFRDALKDFFSALGGATLGTHPFDPKVVYDHYENRFLVVALERTQLSAGDPANDSRILVAVSKTATPATATSSDWWYLAINSKINIGGNDHWADYPGFEIDEEAVYITNNMYDFSSVYGGVRLWIIDKGVVGGFYAGSTPAWNIFDPIPSGFFAVTTMPALVFGAGGVGGVGSTTGTFLVGYSSLTTAGPGAVEWVQVIRVDNPLGATSFTGQFVNVGDLEDVGGIYGFPAIPDAPQSGTAALIEVNDSRALDAVWRNNRLWFTTTINPNVAYDATNTGQATAHWFNLNTGAVPITLADQGDIGGEDIATYTWTFFPAVAVNQLGDAKFGFCASADAIYCGAYYTVHEAGDPAGSVQASGTVQVGLDYYLRTFGAGRNRWGDYTGASVDPVDDTTFWLFNQYAEYRGTGTPPEDGRWGTAWRSCLKVMDFGDAPDPTYPTLLARNGARHALVPGAYMGTLVDAEPDGIPHPNALGDDLTLSADEDGVLFISPLIAGQPAQVQVTVSLGGWLDAWIDFNANGSWLDPGEKVIGAVVVPGANLLNISVPAGATVGTTFSRFRYNLGGIVLAPTGLAPDGEVEDYQVLIEEPIEEVDWGDAPDPSYPTLSASTGASHIIVPSVFMGTLIDGEPDGQPHPNAKGDDLSNLADEDGVAFVTSITAGQPAQLNVTVSVNGWLDVWFDFNINGSWSDPGEQVFSGPVVPGVNGILFNVPITAASGTTFSRFRYNTVGALPFTGPAPDGEVEDYEVFVEEPLIDFGDAPDPTYPTLLASGGASHAIDATLYLGAMVDNETNGQPNANATGDDISSFADEDGVVFTSLLDPTKVATVDVTASKPGMLDAWIDFDASGSWSPSEHIFASTALVAGVNSLSFNVPAVGKNAAAYTTFARFRFSTAGGLSPGGGAADGEVEDYMVQIEADVVTSTGQIVPTHYALHDAVPNPFNPQTTLSFSLPYGSHVRLMVYDVSGRLVTTLLDEYRDPGVHSVVWDGRDRLQRRVASGVYLYSIEAGSFFDTKRMVLVK